MAVKVEIESTSPVSDHLPCIRIYENDQLVMKVIANVELMPGATGHFYWPTLKKVEQLELAFA